MRSRERGFVDIAPAPRRSPVRARLAPSPLFPRTASRRRSAASLSLSCSGHVRDDAETVAAPPIETYKRLDRAAVVEAAALCSNRPRLTLRRANGLIKGGLAVTTADERHYWIVAGLLTNG